MDDSELHAGVSWYMPYLRALEKTGVSETQRPMCILWIERFEVFFKGKPLSTAVREDVESFIANLQAAPGAEDWKIRRASDALKVLLTAV